MNDVLPKPFTKDSLLGMLEKHLLHLKQIQEVGSSIPASIGSQRVIELATEPQHTTRSDPLPPSTTFDTPLPLEDPFLHDRDYTTAYRQSTDSPRNTYPQQSTSKGKRRTVNEKNLFEDVDRSATLPSSAGHNRAAGKRTKYNTHSS
jgi:hypothetical protein